LALESETEEGVCGGRCRCGRHWRVITHGKHRDVTFLYIWVKKQRKK